jgi:hypothetical protein
VATGEDFFLRDTYCAFQYPDERFTLLFCSDALDHKRSAHNAYIITQLQVWLDPAQQNL